MNVLIKPGKASGVVTAPPSKSMAHRYLICAALADGDSIVRGLAESKDILATLDCIQSLGAKVRMDGADAYVTGIASGQEAQNNSQFLQGAQSKADSSADVIEAGVRESGSTLRFFIPIAWAMGLKVCFQGSTTLMGRPMSVYEELAKAQGLGFVRGENRIEVSGRLQPGTIEIPGNISSQFVTGLLYALAMTGEESRIKLTTEVESRPYIDLTLEAMAAFGVKVVWESDRVLYLAPGQQFVPGDIRVEGDYSNAAFLDALDVIGGDVRVEGLREDSLQGDKVYKQLFEELKAGYGNIDIADCPDLGPILFAVAAALNGGTFNGTARLKIKESDRGTVMCAELAKFGVQTEQYENSIIVKKSELKTPSEPLSGANDHRIVMSMATLLSLTGGEIEGAQAVTKSYPDYFDVIRGLGIDVTEKE